MKKRRLAALLLAAVMTFAGTPVLTESLSASVSAASKLSAPKNFRVAAATDSSVTLSWSAVSGASAYRVYKYDSIEEEYVAYKTVSGTSCMVKNLKQQTKYKFKVAALVKKNGKYKVQKKSSFITATTKSKQLLAAPSGIKMYCGTSEIKLTWFCVSGADAYRVYIYDDYLEEYKEYKIVYSGLCTIVGLRSNSSYSFKVSSLKYDEYGHLVEQSISKAISGRTLYSSFTYRSAPAELNFPEPGASATDAVWQCGMADLVQDVGSTSVKQGALRGYALFKGVLSQVKLIFNEHDQLFRIDVATVIEKDDYDKMCMEAKYLYGDPSSKVEGFVRYDSYKTETGDYMLSYEKSSKSLIITVIFNDYIPKKTR